MWSSCPCVRTIASTRSARSRTYSKSGSTRSMPGISACGNDSPTSTTRILPPSSTQAMFRPTSPTPPRNTTRAGRAAAPVRRLEEAGIHEGLLDSRAFLPRRRHERESRRAGREAEDVERRLDRNRVGGDEQRVEQGRELLVDLPSSRDVTGGDELGHLPDPRADQVRGH